MLPSELASIGEPEERATEYLHYRQFFMIWETLERVVEYQALDVPNMNKETRLAWLGDYRVDMNYYRDPTSAQLLTRYIYLPGYHRPSRRSNNKITHFGMASY